MSLDSLTLAACRVAVHALGDLEPPKTYFWVASRINVLTASSTTHIGDRIHRAAVGSAAGSWSDVIGRTGGAFVAALSL